jgi:uncharacterized SAM-binding protein YcdF (DUF218 family)
MDKADKDARIIWDYMKLDMPLHKCNIILTLGGQNTSPARRAAELYLQGYGKFLVFSGGFGKLTNSTFTKTEAEIFAEIAVRLGVPEDKIIKETKSTNTGENIRNTYELLQRLDNLPESVLLVTKPYFERRAYATFMKQWPASDTEVLVTSPQVSFTDYFKDDAPDEKRNIISVMVGDFQRIIEYPKMGRQIGQEVPAHALKAYENLVRAGYDKYLITSS